MAHPITSSLRRYAKRAAITGGLELSVLLQALGRMRDAAGFGAIFTLHHVRPHESRGFEPNRHLEVSPDFLESAIVRLKKDGVEFIALEEIAARMAAGSSASRRRFVAMTLDDANRNNAEYALPVFERHRIPFTIFAAKGLCERTHSMWWETLAELIRSRDKLSFDFGAGIRQFSLHGEEEKQRTFERFTAFIHGTDEAQAVSALDRLARENGIEPLDIVRSLIMDAAELSALARHPLASFGAHTVSHRAMARLDDTAAATEVEQSVAYLESLTGVRPTFIAYPYGTKAAVSDRDARLVLEAGLSIGVTTQPGTIDAGATGRMTYLPRISLNGLYQKPRYASALASGIPIRLLGRKS